MSHNYEQDQEKLTSAVGQGIQTAVSTGVTWWLSRVKPIKIEIKSASDDLQQVNQGIKEGQSKDEILKSIEKSETAKRVKNSGGDPSKYSNYVFKKAEIKEAVSEVSKQKNLQQQDINLSKGKTL
ncbi:hypothetical protein cce_5016 [Crocosphaera subtropica ATCC 51142]|uniref:Uncharacterized protein n=1 Tax=Crocosphaera subtropica (strain ATCC 51142 / BH68) TaxID=43989 RepID=B1X2K1_CROS5|nr:hypothetical protein [Crocosphaera subtropica]ACB54362.1 hypothetical protein cce_5016 [Crocosphaera subtropica ATCC 51142]